MKRVNFTLQVFYHNKKKNQDCLSVVVGVKEVGEGDGAQRTLGSGGGNTRCDSSHCTCVQSLRMYSDLEVNRGFWVTGHVSVVSQGVTDAPLCGGCSRVWRACVNSAHFWSEPALNKNTTNPMAKPPVKPVPPVAVPLYITVTKTAQASSLAIRTRV